MKCTWWLGIVTVACAVGAGRPGLAQTAAGYPSFYGSPSLNSGQPFSGTASYPTTSAGSYRVASSWQQTAPLPEGVAPSPPQPESPAASTMRGGTAPGSGDMLVDGHPHSAAYPGYGGFYGAYYGWCGGGMGGGACDTCGPVVGVDGCATQACCYRWNVYVGGLVMTRDRPNKLWTTYQTDVNERQLLFPPDVDWSGGGEVRLGRAFGCCCEYQLEAVFWILDDMTADVTYNALANGFLSISTPLNVSLPPVAFPSDQLALDEIFDSAAEHRLRRTSNFLNVELNLWGGRGPTCGRFSGSWLAGVRFLRFRDNLLFGSSNEGFIFGLDPSQDAYIESDVENNLVGFQIGGRGEACVTRGLTAFVAPTIGIYGNHITQDSSIYRGTGELAVNLDTNNALAFDTSKNDFSMIGQIDVGLAYAVGNWRFHGGYRAIGLTGVALADNQIPFYVGAEDEWQDIDSNGHVILHGAFAGAEYRF